ncbi:hypothetical protein LCGC14_1451220 [marine sediment metagenome]|uniref:Uncharacterized protein n=1 Tax=marine sediment metagenome TaxID=412755 RepID=A0A0F9JIJ8_9ZZZZ
MPKILSRGLEVLRHRMVAPRVVNSVHSNQLVEIGSPVWVQHSSERAAQQPAGCNVFLDQWRQNCPIGISDEEMAEIENSENDNFLPMQMVEAIKGLANTMNQHVYSKYSGETTGVYNFISNPTGGTGTILDPFGTGIADTSGVSAATGARGILNSCACPRTDRRGVLSFNAEAAMLDLGAVSDTERIGGDDEPICGEIGRKFGINWFADDYLPVHTVGTSYNNGRGGVTLQNAESAGASGVSLLGSNAGTLAAGDIIVIGDDKQTYCVVGKNAPYALHPTNGMYVSIVPVLQVAQTGGQKIEVKNSHRNNFVFHPDAFCFASGFAVLRDAGREHRCIMSMTDPVTGMALRLEAKFDGNQIVWVFDILYGTTLAKPEYCVRVAGAV